jgi:nitrogen regulatory protein P-II 1
MKKIEAIIKPFKLDDVKAGLGAIGATGLTISEVSGSRLQEPRDDLYRGVGGPPDSAPKVKIEIITGDDQAAQVATVIARTALGEHDGEDTITIMPVDEVVRVRTGERGEAAV